MISLDNVSYIVEPISQVSKLNNEKREKELFAKKATSKKKKKRKGCK